MLFSSIGFLYYFLPLVLALYYLAPAKLKNIVLLGASLFFYFYGEPVFAVLILASSVLGYVHGLWISRCRTPKTARLALVSAVASGLFFLILFKYADFMIINLNRIPGLALPLPGLRLPIGISFYTFQILSYVLDVYYGKARVQKSLVRLTTYVALFPQLIAGPIVRYNTIESELNGRRHSWANMAGGIGRFVTGLAKKILIANVLGELADQLSRLPERTVLYYWLVGLSFMLQIYFDFSAYSDMAIGLGRMFGFHFQENFNYPLIARSITDFWRRWHISLGTWFRDYVYIPLGGNRVSKLKWLRNIVVVWALTGLWHGAAWNFIIWGLYFAVVLVAEKWFLAKPLASLPAFLQHVYTLLVALISFVIFNADSLQTVGENLRGLIGVPGLALYSPAQLYYLRSYALVLVMAVVGATPLVRRLANRLTTALKERLPGLILEPVLYLVLLLVCTAYLVDGSFNPFLYFRF